MENFKVITVKTNKDIERVKIERINMEEESRKINFVIDKDPKMEYEIKRFWYLVIFPLSCLMTIWAFLKTLFWAVVEWKSSGKRGFLKIWFACPKNKEELKPQCASIFFDRFCKPLKDIRYGAASWKALDLIYNHKFGHNWSLTGKLSDFWINMINAQAVRNRKRLIRKTLRNIFDKITIRKNVVKVFSVACGSAEAMIEAVREFKDKQIRIEVTLLDLDRTALDYARNLAEKHRIIDQFTFVRASVREIEKRINEKFDVVEMLGFLDYQTFFKGSKLIARLRAMLNAGGYFLTCNICPNIEMWFMRWVLSWPMIYRTPYKLGEMMIASGFKKEDVQLIAEPHKAHCLAICKK